MSHKSVSDSASDSLATRFRDSLSCDHNKPDFKKLDLATPASSPKTVISAASGGSSSSSSSSSGKSTPARLPRAPNNNHSGELSGRPESKPRHRRSVSAGAPLIYSGGGTATSSPGSSIFPTGNVCPTRKTPIPGSISRGSTRPDVLGSGTGNYGHGSIIRSGTKLSSAGIGNGGFDESVVKRAMSGCDPEEVKRMGNEMYRSGNFVEALALYDRAVALLPGNAAYRSNRAAALTALGRLCEAARECEEAVRLEPGYARAHQRLASLYMRFGQVENSQRHLSLSGLQPDQSELQKVRLLEKHLNRCANARKIGDWKSALREADAAIAVGADFSPQLVACKAEAYLKLHQLVDAESVLSNIPKFEGCPPSFTQTKFFGMIGEAYVPFVCAQVEMTMGRFENAVAAAEKASRLDYSSIEVARILNIVKTVARARSKGNDLFSSGKISEACSAYGEGLKYDSSNYVLYCNRAVCWSKLGLWEQSVEDCNQALNIQPNYIKALFRRAASNAKLERWAEVVKDYETLSRELPGDIKVAESLHQAQQALQNSREEVYGTKFGVEVEEISTLNKFKTAIATAGVSLVHFKEASNELCEDISPFINTLCVRYPSVKFIKVDVEESIAIAKAESIRSVPTFKIYKNGEKVKEMIRPSHQFLEDSVKTCANL